MKDLISKIYEVQAGETLPQPLAHIEHAIAQVDLMLDDKNIYRFLLDVLDCREHNIKEYTSYGFKIYVFSLLHLRGKNLNGEPTLIQNDKPDYATLLKNFEAYDYAVCFDGGEKYLNRCVFVPDIFCLLELAKEYDFQQPSK